MLDSINPKYPTIYYLAHSAADRCHHLRFITTARANIQLKTQIDPQIKYLDVTLIQETCNRISCFLHTYLQSRYCDDHLIFDVTYKHLF